MKLKIQYIIVGSITLKLPLYLLLRRINEEHRMGGTCSINVDEVTNSVHLDYILQHAVSCDGNIFSNTVFLFAALNYPALNVLQS